MKLVMFRSSALSPHPGALLPGADETDTVDLIAAFNNRGLTPPPSIATPIVPETRTVAAELVQQIANDPEAARAARLVCALSEVELLAPLREHPMIICGGMNYRAHNREMSSSAPDPILPPSFIKSPYAVVGPGSPIRLPREYPGMVDFEGELCVVIGRPCSNVSREEAMRYVGGYTIINDVSARDFVLGFKDAKMEPMVMSLLNIAGKQFPSFCPCGPVILTADEVSDPKRLHITTTVNSTVMQDSDPDDLVFDIPSLVSEFSRFYTLQPGDLISTGSPPGVGAGRKPPVFLKAGDEVCITVRRIGSLRNPVVAGG